MGKIKGRQATQGAVHGTAAISADSPLVSMWQHEVAAAQSTRKREVIQAAAAAGGGTAKDIRRRRLQLTVEAAHGERAAKARSALLTKKDAGLHAASAPTPSAFADMLAALPATTETAAKLNNDPFGVVLSHIKPTSRATKKTRTKLDVGAVAQFAALVNVGGFRAKPLSALGKHLKAVQGGSEGQGDQL